MQVRAALVARLTSIGSGLGHAWAQLKLYVGCRVLSGVSSSAQALLPARILLEESGLEGPAVWASCGPYHVGRRVQTWQQGEWREVLRGRIRSRNAGYVARR